MNKKPHRILKRVLFVIAILLLLVIIAGASAIIWYQSNISAKYDVACSKEECTPRKFVVASGDSAQSIAERLESEGIIKSAFAFRIYLTLQASNKNLLPGDYMLTKSMSVEQIVQAMNNGIARPTVSVTLFPGETIRGAENVPGVRSRLIAAGFKEAEVDAALSKEYSHELLSTKPQGASLEGYLWADTYQFYADESVENIIVKLLDHTLKFVKDENLIAKFEQRGLTLHQGITLASVIQKESPASYDEKRHIAQVFESRLKQGIPLGSDAVVAFQADQINPGRNRNDMSYFNTIGCPWNSRRCQGLPPTPISMPNRDSLKAVTEPTDTDDLYFLADDQGNMYYAKTEAGHQQNIKAHCGEVCKIL